MKITGRLRGCDEGLPSRQIAHFMLIIKNRAIDLMRRDKPLSRDERPQDLADTDEAFLQIEDEEGYQARVRCIMALPEMYKTVFVLRYRDRKSTRLNSSHT